MQEKESFKCDRCSREFKNVKALGGHKPHCKGSPVPLEEEVAEQPQQVVMPPQDVVEEEPKPDELDIEKGKVSEAQVAEILEGEWWTIKQLAEAVSYSTIWITRMCQDQRIKAIKPTGGQWRIPKSEVQRVMKEGIPPLPRQEKEVEEPTRIEVEEEVVHKVAPVRKEPDEVEGEGNPYWPLPFSLKGKGK